MVETDAEKIAHLVQGLRDDFKDLKYSKQVASPSGVGSSSNVNFNVHAGGIGFRLVVLACVCQLLLTLCGMGFVIYVSMHQDATLAAMQVSQNRQQDYLNIILQWSPELRKQIEQKEKNP